MLVCFFFFNDTATTEIYTLSLHDALPISTSCSRTSTSAAGPRSTASRSSSTRRTPAWAGRTRASSTRTSRRSPRSEEHTSELQSRQYLVCRLLLEKKKKTNKTATYYPLHI